MTSYCRSFSLSLLLIAIVLGISHSAAQEAPPQVGLLELYEISFDLVGDFENPYDPNEISVDAIFIAPSGENLRVPAFYRQPYAQTCQTDCDTDRLQAVDTAAWVVRFSPTQVGDWSYHVEATGANGTATIREGTFTVTEQAARGFVRVSPNKRYFTFQNGEAYFPIGENLGWSADNIGGMATYLKWLDDLQASGANYARIFVDTAWFIGLDWGRTPGDYSDDQAAAWRMDTLLEAAEERGIYLQVVLIWHRAFIQNSSIPVVVPDDIPRADTGADFDGHSFNAINGGVLNNPNQFFQSSTAKALLKQRLRYMIARWGYSPSIFAWELITDVDRLPGYNSDQHLDYINELADYVRQTDPYPHLLTVGSSQPLPELINNDRFDFAGVQLYQQRPLDEAGDQASEVLSLLQQNVQTANKPVLLTEFSINPYFEPTSDDPTGIHVRDTLWASALSGAGGGGMSQWWDTYIAPQNLYPLYTALTHFTAGIDWNILNLEPLQVGLVAQKEVAFEALRIEDFNRNFGGISPPDTIYRLLADGAVPSTTSLSSYLYGIGGYNAVASRPQTFIVTPPMDTSLAIGIRDISPGGNANLNITLDNQAYASLELTAGSTATTINIPLPAGEHRLVLDNTGKDWVELEYIEIPNYRAPLRAVALADRMQGVALVWLQNRAATWQNAAQTPEVLRFRMDIPNMPTGVYRVEFWDTQTGNMLGQEFHTVDEQDSGLSIMLLPIQRQLALRVFRVQAGEVTVTLPTPFPTRTPAIQATATATETASPTLTLTPSPTASASSTPTDTASPTATPTATASPTSTATLTPSATPTEPLDSTPTPSPSPQEAPPIIPRETRTPRPS